MNKSLSKVLWTIGLLGVSAAALAGEPKVSPPQEPAGFVLGGVIGGFAAGPFGAVIGAGLGTWLGNRVHRAGEAAKAEAEVASLVSEKASLAGEKASLVGEKASLARERSELAEANRALTAQLAQVSQRIEAVQNPTIDGGKVLDGLQGDVLFRTGSSEVTDEMAHQIQVLAQAVAKAPTLKVRVDGYADPRGTDDANMKLSEARAYAVRDLFLAAGVNDEALEVNAYGKSKSVAADGDGYALERRVRLTLQAEGTAAVAQVGENQ
jgi:outer membrane protein OmpA-like peptidoglycan-associated protein